MREINMETWPRVEHFKMYSGFDQPYFSMCANVDVSALTPLLKLHQISFTVGVVFVLSKVANGILEFRTRIRGERVIEHDVVHPSITLLTPDETFSFCTLSYEDDFASFAAHAAKEMDSIRQNPTIQDEPGQDDLLFLTSIPWVSFTSFMHPVPLDSPDSFPRFAWGKCFDEGGVRKMPLSVQVHHALMDGLHVGRFYQQMQATLNQPEALLPGL